MVKRNQSSIGIDLSDKTANFCAFDAEHGIVAEGRIALTVPKLAELWRLHGPVDIVVIEAGTPANWVRELFEGLGARVITADPRKLQAVTANVRKCDERDARMLARLGLADEELLSPTYARAPEHRRAMALLKIRDHQVRVRTSVILEVRSQVKLVGGRMPPCDAAHFHEHQESLPDDVRDILDPLFDTLRALDLTIETLDEKIKAEGLKFPIVQRLAKIDGIGPITALAFVALIGDPARFSRTRDVGAYLGLVPRRDQSGGSDPARRITKAGSSFLRRLLGQCAHNVCRAKGKDTKMRRWALGHLERLGKTGKRKVIIAVARRLAVLMLSLWKSGQDWIPLHRVPADNADDAPNPVVLDECALTLAQQGVLENAPSAATRTHACTGDPVPTKSANGSKGRSGASSTSADAPTRASRAQRVADASSATRPATPSAPATPACAGDPASPAAAARARPRNARGRDAATGVSALT